MFEPLLKKLPIFATECTARKVVMLRIALSIDIIPGNPYLSTLEIKAEINKDIIKSILRHL